MQTYGSKKEPGKEDYCSAEKIKNVQTAPIYQERGMYISGIYIKDPTFVWETFLLRSAQLNTQYSCQCVMNSTSTIRSINFCGSNLRCTLQCTAIAALQNLVSRSQR